MIEKEAKELEKLRADLDEATKKFIKVQADLYLAQVAYINALRGIKNKYGDLK